MKLFIEMPDRHYHNIMSLDAVSLGRIPYKGIIMYAINAIKHGKILDHEPTTKNNLGVDCISRADARSLVCKIGRKDVLGMSGKTFQDLYKGIDDLSSVTPQLSSETRKNSKKLEKDFGELDCISRAEAIKCLECDFDITGKENMKTVVNYINSAHDKIVNLPRVKQEPKTGKWISTETKGVRYAFWCRYKCSLCGGLSDHTNFCPNCGAKMESEDKE